METDDGQEKYLKQYIQRQEILLLDYIRKNIDLEIKVISLNSSLLEFKNKYEESQKQVEVQNDLMQQAATGVETLTVENKKYEKMIGDLEKISRDFRSELNEYKSKCSNAEEELKLVNARLQEIREEYSRQTQELGELFKENEDLKTKLSINKSKVKTAKLPPDRKSTRLNSSHIPLSRMPSSA